jgi:chorismate dehydratase
VQILEHNYWKYGLDFVSPNTRTEVPTGHLAIGDRCFQNEAKYEYVTDLGDVWKRYTGLPFLFAAWVSLKPVDKDLWRRLDTAFAEGIAQLEHIDLPPGNAHVDLRHYLQQNIKYRITDDMLKGARSYLKLARELSKHTLNADSTPSGQSVRTNG